MEAIKRYYVKISGIVQGVGFRPFIYHLAKSLSLFGWVKNSSLGVEIQIEGKESLLREFLERVQGNPPVLSKIKTLSFEELPILGFSEFKIMESISEEDKKVFISPDISTCQECERELRDEKDRRFLYPFINCTHCGPRFTIVKDIPYDREKTTMKVFPMCNKCRAEYENPEDRRYHAQPVSCFDCGPQLELLEASTLKKEGGGAKSLSLSAKLLEQGKILAIKGLGGYHLACDGLNQKAIQELRKRKIRDDKPFALMVRDMETALAYCEIGEAEKKLLESPQKPIVLLKKRPQCNLPAMISPGNPYLGIMLPYTPLHLTLFLELEKNPRKISTLVMTSGNRTDEPIYYEDKEALENLNGIADYFLTHDREIYIRTDDSVTRVFGEKEYILRRSRGYVPTPLTIDILEAEVPSVLACGGEQKNTFSMNRGEEFFLSHHIGDLENLETLKSYETGIQHFQKLFDLDYDLVAYDLHPQYLSTQYAMNLDHKCKIPVQHHHAHVASCMAENGLNHEVIGVAFDGTGYGEDGNLWGGEFFTGSYGSFQRRGHFQYMKMPGGAMAVKEPWRMAVSYLYDTLGPKKALKVIQNLKNDLSSTGPFQGIEMGQIENIVKVMEKNLHCPLTSSAGRLFDAVSALLGIRSRIHYEGQAAVEMEFLLGEGYEGEYGFQLQETEQGFQVQVGIMILSIFQDLENHVDKSIMVSKFHETLSSIILEGCKNIREKSQIQDVVLSGGVFQNMALLHRSVQRLEGSGFTVYTHSKVPTNDGGLCLGQALIAIAKSRVSKS